MDLDYYNPPKRRREDIKRSRGNAIRDQHFSERNNHDFICFCKATGLRRSEIAKLKGKDIISRSMIIEELKTIIESSWHKKTLEDALYFDNDYYLHVIGKGGRERYSPIIGEYAGMVITRMKNTLPEDKVWLHVPSAHERLEPDVSQRLRGLRRICVDETSYRKGHKYITVVYDLDRNRVAWVHEGHGYEVFKLFCESLTKEECQTLEVIAGDSAGWIDQCKTEYFKQARRCVDFFHVVGWVNEALVKSVTVSDRKQSGKWKI